MKYLMVLLIAVCLLLTSVSAYAQSETAKQEVIKADRARDAAIKKGDGEAWAAQILDECRWTNLSTGEVQQNKSERAADFTKDGPAEPWKLSNEKFHIGETLVTQTGVYTDASGMNMHFARVWTKQDGKWLMAALYLDRWPE